MLVPQNFLLSRMVTQVLMQFQFFLSNRAVYLLLWTTRLGFEHAGLDFWLSSIKCHAPKSPVFVIGTHCDMVKILVT